MNRYKNNFYCKFSQLHVQIPYKSENSDFCSKHAPGEEKWGGGVTRKNQKEKKCENNYTQTGKSKQNRGDKDQPAFDTF